MSYKLNIIIRHGLQTRASDSGYSCSYSFIVPGQERTGRDLSLRNYNHEKGDATIAPQTIDQPFPRSDLSSLWVERL
ncbi:MAG TPA: hypothetical protein VIG72_09135 [Pontibacter sp.]